MWMGWNVGCSSFGGVDDAAGSHFRLAPSPSPAQWADIHCYNFCPFRPDTGFPQASPDLLQGLEPISLRIGVLHPHLLLPIFRISQGYIIIQEFLLLSHCKCLNLLCPFLDSQSTTWFFWRNHITYLPYNVLSMLFCNIYFYSLLPLICPNVHFGFALFSSRVGER